MSKRALGHHFFVIDNQMILHFDLEVYHKFYPIIDFETIEIIASNDASFHYFKDKHQVYVESHMNRFTILPEANPDDFKILDFEKGRTNSGANDYLFDKKLPYQFTAYELLGEFYQKVGRQVFFDYTKELLDVDAVTFEVLHPDEVKNVAKDKNHVYFRNQVVEEADAESFYFLPECFNNEYYREQDHTYYAKDKNQAYYIDTIAKAFKVIKTKQLSNFHFKVVDGLGYADDGQYQYLFGKRKK